MTNEVVSYDSVRFDAFKQPHYYIDPLTVFVGSNERMYASSAEPDPYRRKYYKAAEVQVFGTRDSRIPKIETPEGEEIPYPWMTFQGMQYLLLCFRTTRVLSLTNMSKQTRNKIPDNKYSAKVYWACEKALPVGGHILVQRPINLTTEQKSYYKEMQAAAKFIYKLNVEPQFPSVRELTPKFIRSCIEAGNTPSAVVSNLPLFMVGNLAAHSATHVLSRDSEWYPHMRLAK